MALVDSAESTSGPVYGTTLKPMEDGDVLAVVESEISDSVDYDNTLIGQRRKRAIEYYQGKMRNIPAQENRSGIVSRELSDTVDWMMPDLMEIFMGSTKMVEYLPSEGADDEMARQATDYVNYVFLNECNGYDVVWDGIWNALVCAAAPLKIWWDTSIGPDVSIHRGLTEEQYAYLVAPDDVEVMQVSQYVEEIQIDGAALQIALYDCKIRRITSGRLAIMAMPPEELLISRDAQSFEESKYIGHRSLKTRSELVEMGFDVDLVYSLPTANELETEDTRLSRFEELDQYGANNPQRAAEKIELVESYILADADGDGIAERLQVFTAGRGSGRLLSWQIWEDDHPFCDLVPIRMPHRWYGRSIWDLTADLMQIRTVLLRQMLDNLYWVNNPQTVGMMEYVENPDEVISPSFGGLIDINPASPVGTDAIRERTIPFVANQAFPMLDYIDHIQERRTGVSDASMAVSPDALQNQNVDAVNMLETNSQKKVTMIARNFARSGFKRLFDKALKLIVKNQDRPRMIRLRGEMVEMDPRSWNANMDASVNVGLGTGSKTRDLQALYGVWAMQKQALEMFGQNHPYSIRLIQSMQNTATKIVEASGLSDPSQYIPDLTDDDMALIIAQAEAASEQPTPAELAMQVESAKLEADLEKARENNQAKLVEAELETRTKLEQTASQERIKALEIDQRKEIQVAEMTLKEQARQDDMQMDRLKLAIESVSAKASVLINTSEEEAANPAYQSAVTDLNAEVNEIKAMLGMGVMNGSA